MYLNTRLVLLPVPEERPAAVGIVPSLHGDLVAIIDRRRTHVGHGEEGGELDKTILIVTLLTMVIVLALIFPKIYIASNIYYESVEVDKLKKQYDILLEENKRLSQQIEQKKFINE